MKEQRLFNCFIHCCAAHFVRVLRTWKTVCKHIFSLYKMSHWRWIWIQWALYNWKKKKKHPWSGPSTRTLYISTLQNYLTLFLFCLISMTQRTQGRPLQHLPLSLSLSLSALQPLFMTTHNSSSSSSLVLSCAPHHLLHINPFHSMQHQNFYFSQSQRLVSLSIRLYNRFSRLRLSK